MRHDGVGYELLMDGRVPPSCCDDSHEALMTFDVYYM